MLKPPKAWNRNPAQKYKSAEQCRVRHPSELNYLCLIGTALSDLPPKDSPLYSIIKCPVLILQVEGDENHPVSTAMELQKLIGQSIVHIAETEEIAKQVWPKIIKDFTDSLLEKHN